MNIQEANQIVQEWINEGDKHADLDLDGLTSAEGLTLPTRVNELYLNGLTSAEGLTLPRSVWHLSLNGLTSAVGLTLPESVGGDISLNGLPESDKEALRKRLADKIK